VSFISGYSKINYKRGAAVLGATTVAAKLIGAVYKLPLLNILGDAGTAHFQVTYQIYAVLLAVSTTGIPVALSRLVSAALATDRPAQARRLFSVALPAFGLLGAVLMLAVFCFAGPLAALIGDTEAAAGIRVLSPAVLLVCLIAVYEGYAQGHRDTIPTSVKQFTEVLSKLVVGLSAAWWLLRRGSGSPAVAAGAISGVPVGLLLTLIILVFYKKKADKVLIEPNTIRYDRADRRRRTLKNVLKISIPVTVASSLMSVLTLIDMGVVLDRLQAGAGFAEDMAHTLYGVYAKGLTLMVLPSALIIPVSVGIIPAITAALALGRHRQAGRITDVSLKLTSVLAMPAAAGLCVLAYPIFRLLYPDSNANGPACLSILGIASYFVCMQLVTTALLHANGLERTPVLTFLAGGAAQIAVDYILVSRPDIHIIGSPVGSVVCYLIITAANLIIIRAKLKNKLGYRNLFVKPMACCLAMAAAARSVYELLWRLTADMTGGGQLGTGLCLAGAIAAAATVYGVLVIATKTITREDVLILPKGQKIAHVLRMK
jgi:stage V sporulation protein B